MVPFKTLASHNKLTHLHPCRQACTSTSTVISSSPIPFFTFPIPLLPSFLRVVYHIILYRIQYAASRHGVRTVPVPDSSHPTPTCQDSNKLAALPLVSILATVLTHPIGDKHWHSLGHREVEAKEKKRKVKKEKTSLRLHCACICSQVQYDTHAEHTYHSTGLEHGIIQYRQFIYDSVWYCDGCEISRARVDWRKEAVGALYDVDSKDCKGSD